MAGLAFAFEFYPLHRVCPEKSTSVFFDTVIAQRRAAALGAELYILALVDAIHPSAPRTVLETVFRRRALAVVADPALLACAPKPTFRRARRADARIPTHSGPTFSVGTMGPVLAAGARKTPDRLGRVLSSTIG